ncbi:hypothetical protein BJ508DRAFT_323040 [Ascobolus immersus RN42]|uniref:TPR-like protein n=1 Tax=Ascobolus immersus RN42 TaxID=1160509 RepID=A0A3N4IHA9_ASCIM|nr:hypothetical protein BJ508DRAFT_323040 [Ascobolus immersus RN42]
MLSCCLGKENANEDEFTSKEILSRIERLNGKQDEKTIEFLRAVGVSFHNHEGFKWSLEWYNEAYERRNRNLKSLFAPTESQSFLQSLWSYTESQARKYELEDRKQIRKEAEDALTDALVDIADALFSLKRYHDALQRYQECLDRRKKAHPPVLGEPAHDSVVSLLVDIAKCHLNVFAEYDQAVQCYIDAFNAATGLSKTLEEFEDDVDATVLANEVDDGSESSFSSLEEVDDGLDVERLSLSENVAEKVADDVKWYRVGAGGNSTVKKQFSPQALATLYSIGDSFHLLGRKQVAIYCYLNFLKAAGLGVDEEGRITNLKEFCEWLKDLHWRQRRNTEIPQTSDNEEDSTDSDEPPDSADISLANDIIRGLGDIADTYFYHIQKPKVALYYYNLQLEACTIFNGELHETTLAILADRIWNIDWEKDREEAYILMLSLLRKREEAHGERDERTFLARSDSLHILAELRIDYLENSENSFISGTLRSALEWHRGYLEKMVEPTAPRDPADLCGYSFLRGLSDIAEIYLLRGEYEDAWQLYEKIRKTVEGYQNSNAFKELCTLLRSPEFTAKKGSDSDEDSASDSESVSSSITTSSWEHAQSPAKSPKPSSRPYWYFQSDIATTDAFAYLDLYAQLALKYEFDFGRLDLAISCLNKCAPVFGRLVDEFGVELISLLDNQRLSPNYTLNKILSTIEAMARVKVVQVQPTAAGADSALYSGAMALYEKTLDVRLEIASRAIQAREPDAQDANPELDLHVMGLRLAMAGLSEEFGDFGSAESQYTKVIALQTSHYRQLVVEERDDDNKMEETDSDVTAKASSDQYYSILVNSIVTFADTYTKFHRFEPALHMLQEAVELRMHNTDEDGDYDSSTKLNLLVARTKIYIQSWKLEVALETLDEAFKCTDDPSGDQHAGNRADLLYLKAKALSYLGKHSEAASTYLVSIQQHELAHRAVKKEHCSSCIRNGKMGLALSTGYAGDIRAGKRICREAMSAFKKINPKGLRIEEGHMVNGCLYMMEERWDKALKELRVSMDSLSRKDSATEMLKARLEGLMGVCEAGRGDKIASRALLEGARLRMEAVCDTGMLARCGWYSEVVHEMCTLGL